MRFLSPFTIALLLCAVVIPALPAYADVATTTIPAGFAPSSIWLSKMSPTAGDKVTIYTVVYNSSASSIEGSVGFYIDGTSVSSVPFTLDAGETNVESVAWVASAGSHALQAKVESAIDKNSKTPQSLANLLTATTTVTVAENTHATIVGGTTGTAVSSTVSAVTDAASNLGSTINNSSPIVSTVSSAIASQTEALREAGLHALSNLSASSTGATTTAKATGSTATTRNSGEVLGTTTYKTPPAEIHQPFEKTGILATLSKFLLPVFLYPALFYPVFFFILVLCLWLLAKRVLRPDN